MIPRFAIPTRSLLNIRLAKGITEKCQCIDDRRRTRNDLQDQTREPQARHRGRRSVATAFQAESRIVKSACVATGGFATGSKPAMSRRTVPVTETFSPGDSQK